MSILLTFYENHFSTMCLEVMSRVRDTRSSGTFQIYRIQIRVVGRPQLCNRKFCVSLIALKLIKMLDIKRYRWQR